MGDSKTILKKCLYFTANSLARVISRMAEEEFKRTGLSPSHAFLMMVVNDNPKIRQKELAKHLNLAPSTVTRFIDTLVFKGYLTRENEGRITKIELTREGKKLNKPILSAWKSLHQRYAKILGLLEGDELTAAIDEASNKLEEIE